MCVGSSNVSVSSRVINYMLGRRCWSRSNIHTAEMCSTNVSIRKKKTARWLADSEGCDGICCLRAYSVWMKSCWPHVAGMWLYIFSRESVCRWDCGWRMKAKLAAPLFFDKTMFPLVLLQQITIVLTCYSINCQQHKITSICVSWLISEVVNSPLVGLMYLSSIKD